MSAKPTFELAAVGYVRAKRDYDLANAELEEAQRKASAARKWLEGRRETLLGGGYMDETGVPRFVVVDRTLLTLRYGDPAAGDMLVVDVRPVDLFDSDGRAL